MTGSPGFNLLDLICGSRLNLPLGSFRKSGQAGVESGNAHYFEEYFASGERLSYYWIIELNVVEVMKSSTYSEKYSVGEEIAHAITHGIGIPLSIAALAILVAFSALYGDAWHVTSTTIYGITLILLYTASTLYHGIPNIRAKIVFQQLDHAAIFLLIAGTYTPFTLVSLRGPWGWTLFGLVWTIAILGVLLEFLGSRELRRWSLALYLGLGWLVLIAINPMLVNVETGGLLLLLAGGLSYSLGAIFYAWQRLPYNHAIWHLFVLTGSVLHFFSVLFYVVPGASQA